MKFGLMFANGARSADASHAAALAIGAEDAGFESLWAVQHVVVPVSYEARYPYGSDGVIPGGDEVAIPDPLVWLGFMGALTRSIKLATGVFVLPLQHPLVVAKQVATLDRLTNGRIIFGVGAGWMPEEFAALDAEFASRGRRLEESIEVMRRAWTEGVVGFNGDTLVFDPVRVAPIPIQAPVPIHLGGHAVTAIRRAARLADGFFPLAASGQDVVRVVERFRVELSATGRTDRVAITTELPKRPEDAERLISLGVDRMVVYAPNCTTDRLAERLGSLMQRCVATVG